MVLTCKWHTCITLSVHISCDRRKYFHIRQITGIIFDLTLVSKNKSRFPQITWPPPRTCSTGFNRCERFPINDTNVHNPNNVQKDEEVTNLFNISCFWAALRCLGGQHGSSRFSYSHFTHCKTHRQMTTG